MCSLPKVLRLPLRGVPLRLSRVQTQPPHPLLRTAFLRELIMPPRLAPIPGSAFSTHAKLLSGKIASDRSSPSRSNAGKAESEQEDPFSTPSASLESLGIGKNMKLLLLVVLSIFGTIETWFWCKAIWIWWTGKQRDEKID